jgi:hypothetical protein
MDREKGREIWMKREGGIAKKRECVEVEEGLELEKH